MTEDTLEKIHLSRREVVARFGAGALLIFVAIGLGDCGKALKDAAEDAQKTESTTKAELRLDAIVASKSLSSAAGSKTIVSVRLRSAPSGGNQVQNRRYRATQLSSPYRPVDVAF